MTPEERAELLAAMYEQPDEELDELDVGPVYKTWFDQQEASRQVSFNTDGKYVTLAVDGKKVSVASGSYVKNLEERVATQDRLVLQMKAQIKAVRQLVNRHETDMSDVWRELDRKINLRDV